MNEYRRIIKHYEECFDKFGDSCKGVDWPNQADAEKRYSVMLDIIKFYDIRARYTGYRDMSKKISVCDIGCGLGHLYRFIQNNQMMNIDYYGIDISSKMIDFCKKKYPSVHFVCEDILREDKNEKYNFIIMNGCFTEKHDLEYDKMWSYVAEYITKAYDMIDGGGLAFNVMSKDVDWERDDLFHVPLTELSGFLSKCVTRDFVIRNDYGLYEYTVYVFR